MAYSPSPYFIGISERAGCWSPFLKVTVICVSVGAWCAQATVFSVNRSAVRLYMCCLVRSCLYSSCVTRSPTGTEQLPGTESSTAEEMRPLARYRAGRILLSVRPTLKEQTLAMDSCLASSPLPCWSCSRCYKHQSLEKWSK